MNTTQVNERLGMVVPVETMRAAGIAEAGRNKRAVLWGDEWHVICEKLAAHLLTLKAARPPAAKPPKMTKGVKKAVKAQADQPELPINGSDDDWESEDL